MKRLSNLLVLAAGVMISTLGMAQTEFHLANDPAHSLFQRSAWAHGYIHGYEKGFHQGNLDFNLGRTARDPHEFKTFKQGKREFKNEFGNKTEFTNGFGNGFEVGYLDGATGKDYQAGNRANELSADNTALSMPTTKDDFDLIIDNGYLQGRALGMKDARASADFAGKSTSCPTAIEARQSCAPYVLGFRWGYSDGYENIRPREETRTAKK